MPRPNPNNLDLEALIAAASADLRWPESNGAAETAERRAVADAIAYEFVNSKARAALSFQPHAGSQISAAAATARLEVSDGPISQKHKTRARSLVQALATDPLRLALAAGIGGFIAGLAAGGGFSSSGPQATLATQIDQTESGIVARANAAQHFDTSLHMTTGTLPAAPARERSGMQGSAQTAEPTVILNRPGERSEQGGFGRIIVRPPPEPPADHANGVIELDSGVGVDLNGLR